MCPLHDKLSPTVLLWQLSYTYRHRNSIFLFPLKYSLRIKSSDMKNLMDGYLQEFTKNIRCDCWFKKMRLHIKSTRASRKNIENDIPKCQMKKGSGRSNTSSHQEPTLWKKNSNTETSNPAAILNITVYSILKIIDSFAKAQSTQVNHLQTFV